MVAGKLARGTAGPVRDAIVLHLLEMIATDTYMLRQLVFEQVRMGRTFDGEIYLTIYLTI
jgi:hypothetical protein